MEFQDYYEVLDVPRDASDKDIKRSYRKLALKWHPDQHQGEDPAAAEERFKAISEAYEVLSDPEKRARYDRFGQHWEQGQEFRPDAGSGEATMSREEFESAFGGGGFSDFFKSMFGDKMRQDFGEAPRGHARYQHRGADVRAELRLPLTDAIRGGKRSFHVPARMSCPTCGGVGFVSDHVCPTCVGVGMLRRDREVELRIPDAPRDGMTLRLKGLGEPGADGGPHGDLHLVLRLDDDGAYRLREGQLEAVVPIAPWESVKGAKVDVRTPRGVVTVTVPKGSRGGQRLRLKGQSWPGADGAGSDLIVVLELALPAALSEEQEALLGELAQAVGPLASGGARSNGDPS